MSNQNIENSRIESAHEQNHSFTILNFYSFTELDNLEELMQRILHSAKRKNIKGTVIIANEGLNGAVAGLDENVESFLEQLKQLTNVEEIMVHRNYADMQPFSKVKIRIKDEIVALKAGDIDVTNNKGEYITPHKWDEFISQEDVVLIDTRNSYEVEIGTFKNAVNPETKSFRDFPEWVEQNKALLEGKKIAMCCTGGIRCEKSTAYLKNLGYDEVYHLKGGILEYLNSTKNINKTWNGKCFVFDDRFAILDDLSQDLPSWKKQKTIHM